MPQPERPATIGEELGQFLESHRSAQENLSDAFTEPVPLRSGGREGEKIQLQTMGELKEIRRDLRNISRHLLVSNIVVTSLLLCFGTGLAFFYVEWFRGGISESNPGRPAESHAVAETPSDSADPLPLVAIREPLSPDDEAFFPLVFDLYLRARDFQQVRPARSESELGGRRDSYVRFLSDAAKLAEQAAEKNISPELLQVIVTITQLAKQNFQHVGFEQPETISLDNQIRAVLRDYTPRNDRRLDPRRM